MRGLVFLLVMLVSTSVYGQTVVPVQLPNLTVPASTVTVPPFDITVPSYDDGPINARVVKLETAMNKIQTAINQLQLELGTIFAAFQARPDEYEMAVQQDSLIVEAPGILENDDYQEPIKIEITRQPSNGVVTVKDDGSLVYTPDRTQLPDGVSKISFDYTITALDSTTNTSTANSDEVVKK